MTTSLGVAIGLLPAALVLVGVACRVTAVVACGYHRGRAHLGMTSL